MSYNQDNFSTLYSLQKQGIMRLITDLEILLN